MAAIDTSCKSMLRSWQMPSVMATVSGMDAATSKALRHSMKIIATRTTITMASVRFWSNWRIFSSTSWGSLWIRSICKSLGKMPLSASSAAWTSRAKASICVPLTYRAESVTARVVCNFAFFGKCYKGYCAREGELLPELSGCAGRRLW
jgi:hypothetical protein